MGETTHIGNARGSRVPVGKKTIVKTFASVVGETLVGELFLPPGPFHEGRENSAIWTDGPYLT